MSLDTQNSASDPRRQYRRRANSEWEIVSGLRDGERYNEKPSRFDGYLHKKRKPPLKGWHKRYFVLEDGILSYSKTPNDHSKGRLHGKIDIGLSVLSFNKVKKKLDIDAEEFVYHIRTKNLNWFEEWIVNLKKHRLYRHSELNYGTRDAPLMTQFKAEAAKKNGAPDSNNSCQPKHFENVGRIGRDSFKDSLKNSGKVVAWLLDNDGVEQCNRDLNQVSAQLIELESKLEKLESLPHGAQNAMDSSSMLTAESPKKGSISKFLSFKSNHKRDRKLSDTSPTSDGEVNSKASASNPSLTKFVLGEPEKDEKMASSTSFLPVNSRDSLSETRLLSEFISKSHQVYSLLKNLNRRINTERERLQQAVEEKPVMQNSSEKDAMVQTLMQQNEELRAKLAEVMTTENKEVELPTSIPSISTPVPSVLKMDSRPSLSQINRSLSLSSKASEAYYDAADNLNEETASVTSSMSSDSSSSDFSEHDVDTGASEELVIDDRISDDKYQTGRRSKLPAPMTVGDSGLISLLTRNIGKDLTRISMPVTLNEPLNTLQVMCEELEYSELLDKAGLCDDPYDRMLNIAAFAVSAYASSNTRAATKPFNPLLGETYECIRLDKGWKFIAEQVSQMVIQVSHHPPISVCHADSENFVFKQDCRVKTKFWGKSLEVHPVGSVSVLLPRFNEEYTWKKVTTCVHNVLGGRRWVDQYGEMVITCNNIKCSLNFIKASYWSDRKHEVQGTVSRPDGQVVHYLFGKWTEAIYCKTGSSTNKCLWRAGNLPEDHEMYYGFTRFAIELNELHDEIRPYLPKTDTRFRPDQRLLEEGKIDEAEAAKHRVEKLQREKRKKRESEGSDHKPMWFGKIVSKDKEDYTYNDDYWRCRREPGFENKADMPTLW